MPATSGTWLPGGPPDGALAAAGVAAGCGDGLRALRLAARRPSGWPARLAASVSRMPEACASASTAFCAAAARPAPPAPMRSPSSTR